MDRRGISKERVLETLAQPYSVVDGKFGRRIAQRIYGDYILRVVFEEHADHILVVTAYPAKAERYL